MIKLDRTEIDFAVTPEARILSAMPYYSGKYLTVVCGTCRYTHYALKQLPEVGLGAMERHYNDGRWLHCQLCGREIPGPEGRPQSKFEEDIP